MTHHPGERHVVIFGATSGMGLAAAESFADRHIKVTAVGRDPDKIAALRRRRADLRVEQADAASRVDLDRLFQLLAPFTDLVVLVTGSAGGGAFESLDLDLLTSALAAKTVAQLRVAQAALPFLAGTGSITFVTAASVRSALPETAGLAAVNGALEAAVPALAAELAPIRVNAISPGVVDTGWWDSLGSERESVLAGFAQSLPVGHVGTVTDIAAAIDFVVTVGFVTATVVTVDGGGHL